MSWSSRRRRSTRWRREPTTGSRMTMRPEAYEHLRTDAVFDQLEALERTAAERGVAMATLALEFLFRDPRITAVIVGPRRPEHLTSIVDALPDRIVRASISSV